MSDSENDNAGIVQLLDRDFDQIPTGIKQMPQQLQVEVKGVLRPRLRATEVNVFNSWLKRPEMQHLLPNTTADKKKFKWVVDNKEEIEKLIKERHQKEHLKTTFLRHGVETIANILLSYDKVKYKEYTRRIFREGIRLQNDVDDVVKENKISDKDKKNWVEYPVLLKLREKLYQEWQNMRSERARGVVTQQQRFTANMKHLALALNVLYPPMRNTWLQFKNKYKGKTNMEFWLKPEPPPHEYTNYLWERQPGQYTVVLNYDKIEGSRVARGKTRNEFALADEIPGVTQGALLNRLIKESYNDQNRPYVLGALTRSKEPMTANTYRDSIMKKIVPVRGKQLNANLIRKIYVNYWYGDARKLNSKQIGEIATRMRHSESIASRNYKKIDVPNELMPEMVARQAPRILEIDEPEQKIKFFDPVTYSKQYRLDFAKEIQAQRKQYYEKNKERVLRAKVLWSLNNKGTKKPRDCTAERYGIVHDKKTKRWKYKDDICQASESREKSSEPKRKREKKEEQVEQEPVAVVRKSKRVVKPTRKIRGEGKKKNDLKK